MVGNYYEDVKADFRESIPSVDSVDFKKLRDDIRNKLRRKESGFFLLIRSLKTVILGDWNTAEKKSKLLGIKDNLLRNGLYAQTIDDYYELSKKAG